MTSLHRECNHAVRLQSQLWIAEHLNLSETFADEMWSDRTVLFFLQAFRTIWNQYCYCKFTSGWTALYFHCKFTYEDNRSCKEEKEKGFLVNYRLLLKHFVLSSEQKSKLQHLSRPLSLLNIFHINYPSISAISLLLLRKYPLRRVLGNPFQRLFYKE